MPHVPYFSEVGSLMYVMVRTRPNLSQAMSVVSHICIILERIIGRM